MAKQIKKRSTAKPTKDKERKFLSRKPKKTNTRSSGRKADKPVTHHRNTPQKPKEAEEESEDDAVLVAQKEKEKEKLDDKVVEEDKESEEDDGDDSEEEDEEEEDQHGSSTEEDESVEPTTTPSTKKRSTKRNDSSPLDGEHPSSGIGLVSPSNPGSVPALITTTALTLDSQSPIDSITAESKMSSYSKSLLESGFITSPTSDLSAINEFSRKTLFPKVKFISGKHQLDSTEKGSVYEFVTEKLHIQEEHKMKWWNLHKEQVYQALRNKRNNATQQMRAAFKSKSVFAMPVLRYY